MIIRTVKMKFEKNKVNDFIKFSNKIKPVIQSHKGCLFLEILRDIKDEQIFFTCSHWNQERDLNNYRNSNFFNEVWPKAKEWFAEKPEAWSLVKTNKK